MVKRRGKWLIILPPLLYLAGIFLIPFGFALVISFADTAGPCTPFTDILSVSPDWHIHLTLNLGNFKYLVTDEVYGLFVPVFAEDGLFSTLICLCLGYPMAYGIGPHLERATQSILLASSSSCRSDLVPAAESTRSRGSSAKPPAQHRAALWLGIIDHPAADHGAPHSRSTSESSIPICPSWWLPCPPPWRSWIILCSEASADLGSPPVAGPSST